jgi:hypothetical protein
MAISMAKSTACVGCKALVYEAETFRGRGWRCGCTAKYIRDLERKLKKLEKENECLQK